MARTNKDQDTTAILDIAYKEVESKMKANLSSYKRYISNFINARSEQLYSYMPSQQIYFVDKDVDDFFNSTKIDRGIINKAIQGTYYYGISNFNPRYAKDECTIAMVCVVRYFKLHKMQKELELALINMSFSGKYYPSIFHASYPKFTPQDHIMDYVITNMCTSKYDIVREGNVIGAIRSVATTWVNAYDDRFKDFHDDDVQYLVQQLHNRIASFTRNIADLYYQAYEKKDYITYDSDDVSEDNYHLATNDAFRLNTAVENTMTTLNTKGIDYRLCKMASNDLVKMTELKSILETLLGDNKNIPLIREYVTLMIVIYMKENKNADITDIDFISYSITPKPNAKNEYMIRQREVLNQMLLNNSEHFARRRNRAATESAYYRAINSYFALTIQQCNK